MSYMHIDNLYKNTDILQFKECYAMEKVHGTSAHVRFKRTMIWGSDHLPTLTKEEILFFAGGTKYDDFVKLFDADALKAKMSEQFAEAAEVTIFGEAYGGKCQGMSKTYGKNLRFVAFEVKIDEHWLNVPMAEDVAKGLGFDFVHYQLIPATLEAIDAERDADSVQAVKNGMGPGLIREGIVLRPLFEIRKNNGERVIAKHKRPEFAETRTPRAIDPGRLQVMADAQAVVNEWVTEMRLVHVLDKFSPASLDVKITGNVITAMMEDIEREAVGEVEISRDAKKLIGAVTAKMFRQFLAKNLAEERS